MQVIKHFVMASSTTIFINFVITTLIFSTTTISESLVHKSSAPFKPNALILPVKKVSDSLHVTTLHKRTPRIPVPLLVDLNGRLLWVNCDDNYLSSTYRVPFCHSAQCARAGVHSCHKCTSSPTPRPGCHNNTCGVLATNPLTQKNAVSELAQDAVSLPDFNYTSFFHFGGLFLGQWATDPRFLFACAPSSLLQGPLPEGVRGVAGLGHSPVALPIQLASHFGFRPEFALCLARYTTQNGTMLIGNIPPPMLPTVMSYTPLTIGSQGDYSILIRSISINNKTVPFNTTLFSKTRGFAGTMISTTVYYTVMEHSIYKTFTEFYARELSGTPQAKAIPPYGLCFDFNYNPGVNVPDIDLFFQNRNVRWRIYGHHAFFYVRRYVGCLRFVDGGTNVRAPITIGTFMLEDNFVHFDLERSRFGFLPNWLDQPIQCSQYYNFSTVG